MSKDNCEGASEAEEEGSFPSSCSEPVGCAMRVPDRQRPVLLKQGEHVVMAGRNIGPRKPLSGFGL